MTRPTPTNKKRRDPFPRLMGAVALMVAVLAPTVGARGESEEALWTALGSPGHFAIMRHALAPGTGDPAGFRIDDCATQRNLSEEGLRQARRTGDAFRAAGISLARVLSSEWCRCLDTARALGLGEVEPEPALNSFFADRARGPDQIARLRRIIAAMALDGPVVLVTHQVVITGLLETATASGEIVVVRRGAGGALEITGKIAPRRGG